ncbi:MAG TPA: glycoside hydrolase family 38 C-terminal domain-containing protein [Acidimicrobiales bacterium]|nr:glycoside hydrolase family 38 C-terminal domain-containing protein [Acidimicrobiales bacterium]
MAESAHIRRRRARRVLRELARLRRGEPSPVSVEAYHVNGEPVPFDRAAAADYVPFRVGDPWGPAWDTTWFRIRGRVPEAWDGRHAALVVGLGFAGGTGFGAEGLVWANGSPLQGVSPNHDQVSVGRPAVGGSPFELYVEAAANPQVDSTLDPPSLYMPDYGGVPLLRLAACHLVVVNDEVEALWHDFAVLLELYDDLPADQPRAARVLRALDAAGRVFDPEQPCATAGAARAELGGVLASPAHASAHRYVAVGNAHIDTAWLWPVRETPRKAARTFSTAVALMERYPGYRFAASQAQQLAWVKERWPELFERIKRRAGEGRFEVVGSMWVEADCNVPSGESLVRQIVHGKRFFADEFGVDTKGLWLPDVFGYPGSLPQILRLAGIDWFLTQKMSWSEVNHFPHHTFWWEGIDGTRVFSHFPPADTYNGNMSVAELSHGVRNFAQKDVADHSLYLFGWGDGGGGPTAAMLERAERLADLEGAPRVELCGAEQAFRTLMGGTRADDLPVWAGELYLEMHRGTYTTHADVKKANRRLEDDLRHAELWSLVAAHAGAPYPADVLDRAWKTLLLHQFHDIIPGSSIHWVYEEAARDHAAVAAAASEVIDAGLARIAENTGGEGTHLVANALSHDRCEVVEVDGVPAVVRAPACGWARQTPSTTGDRPPVRAADGWMENGLLRVEWDPDGTLRSVVHVESGREALAGPGDDWQVFDDRPNRYDAWDIDEESLHRGESMGPAELAELVESGPLRAVLRLRRRWRSSTVDQRIVLNAGSGRLDFVTVVDWRERHRMVKIAFPTTVFSRRASFEIQYGHVERPTHANTSWDEARFESCAHTWVDLSDGEFGVAVLNDSKYGHDVRGSTIRLTALRSPTFPDPEADRGVHSFTYSLMPHRGAPVPSGVAAQAHALNSPLRVVRVPGPGGDLPSETSLVTVADPAVVVTAVKLADTGDGVVVRLYEASGSARRTEVECRMPGGAPMSAQRVDLLERPVGEAPAGPGPVPLSLRPFEIVTLLFRAG